VAKTTNRHLLPQTLVLSLCVQVAERIHASWDVRLKVSLITLLVLLGNRRYFIMKFCIYKEKVIDSYIPLYKIYELAAMFVSSLKGQCHEIFYLRSFLSSTSSMPVSSVIGRLRFFKINSLGYSHLKSTPGAGYTGELIRMSQVRKFFKTTNFSH
jgi:predicted DNA-binding helix-hairpin-helix protein